MKHQLSLLAGLLVFFVSGANLYAADRKFSFTTVEMNGVKVWLPSAIIVHKGDKVTLHATSNAVGTPNVHGFQIEDLNITEVIDKAGKDIAFVAEKTGIFNIRCQMHPQHIGAQILVVE